MIHPPAGQCTGVHKIRTSALRAGGLILGFDFYERRLFSGACLSYGFLANHEKVMGQTTIAVSTTRK